MNAQNVQIWVNIWNHSMELTLLLTVASCYKNWILLLSSESLKHWALQRPVKLFSTQADCSIEIHISTLLQSYYFCFQAFKIDQNWSLWKIDQIFLELMSLLLNLRQCLTGPDLPCRRPWVNCFEGLFSGMNWADDLFLLIVWCASKFAQ